MIDRLANTFLGQVGFLFSFNELKWVIDPYLTDYVEDLYGSKFCRKYAFDKGLVDLTNVQYCLVTHSHEDHCDPGSLALLMEQNSDLRIVCDFKSAEIIRESLPEASIILPKVGETLHLCDEVSVKVIPSAHTSINIEDEYSEFNGYLMEVGNQTLYHPGDTIPDRAIEAWLPSNIDVAFMPVNERNFFRDEIGVIGNMTAREAFQWSVELGVRKVIPTHWDMFGLNSTNPEELILIKENFDGFELKIPVRFKRSYI